MGARLSVRDVTVDGRTLKLLNIIDEFTRECLSIEVDRSIDADHVVRVLDRIAAERGRAAAFVRFDNGPEFVAHAVADWCRFNDCDSVFIDPGSPWQNAWIESFNGRLRDELLNGRQWDSLLEARMIIEDWRIDYDYDSDDPQALPGRLFVEREGGFTLRLRIDQWQRLPADTAGDSAK